MNFSDTREDDTNLFKLNLGEFPVCLVFLACRWQIFFAKVTCYFDNEPSLNLLIYS